MKPFRSDHQLYHVKEEIIEWLENQPFHVLLNFISGQSIKYLRSNQPVLVFSPPDEHYFNLLNYFKKNLQNNAKFYEYKNSFKVIFDYANENSLHFIIQRHFVYPHVLISVDRLYYDYKNRRWKGNREDLLDYQKGLIRIIKPEQLNIKQIFNLIVYCSQMDFILEKETQNKIKKNLSKEEFDALEIEFLRNQLNKILLSAKPSLAFLVMDELGILNWFLPELTETKNLRPKDVYKNDVFSHCIYSCDAIQENKLSLRLAGLLYNIGKAHDTKIKKDGKIIHLNQDVISAKISYKILKRFQYPQEIINKVYFLIRHHMFYYTSNFTDKAIKKFIKKISQEDLEDLILLRLSDRKIKNYHNVPLPPQIRKLLLFIEREKEKEKELTVKKLKFNGNDLKNLGIPEGPIYGKTLNHLLNKVKNEGLPNEKEFLLKEAISFLSQQGILKENQIVY
jgi:tRNA nucleotidyltransferase/poly(A) polymerase